MADDDLGEQFGPYQVFERLGVGGMATVHRARQQGIEGVQRVVALKRLLPHLAEDAAFIKSFVREAKLALLLQHANIVQLFELGKVRNVYFIAMEYIDGRDLRQILRHARKVSGAPTINVTLSILIQACEALEYAHTRNSDDGQPLGLVHRDVSPSNLMVTRSGHVKVIDFGIAKAQIQQLKTHTGKVKGKLAYMAPEATLGRELDARSDLFSIGIIAHELLTARPLFASKSDYQTMLNVQKSDILPPSAFNQAVPPELDAIVMKALARDPDQRYASAAALRDDLHGVRIKYQLSATNREVSAWMDWAFALEAPSASFSTMAPSISGVGATPSPTRMPLRPPSEATPRPSRPVLAEPVDEEAAAIAWGGGRDLDAEADGDGEDHGIADYGDRVHAPPTRPAAELASGSAVMRRGISADTPASSTPIAGAIEQAAPFDPASDPLLALATRRRGSDVLKIALGFALAGVIAAIVVVARGQGGGRAGVQGRDDHAELATLKFIVEPADATIKIAGLEPHAGAPWKIELEPGVVQIKITQPQSLSWETSVELSARETQTIRVVLSPAGADVTQATVVVNSDPPGLTVTVDGKDVGQRTPAKLMLEPGPHKLAVLQDGQVAWSQDLAAEARTQYEFSPSMSDAKRAEREARAKVATAPVAPRPAAPAVVTPAVVTPVAVTAIDAGVAPAIAVVTPAAAIDAGAAPVVAIAPAIVDAGPAKPAPALPVPAITSAPVAVKPAVVPPTAVRRTSGELPKIKHDVRVGQDDPHSVNAKICIDTSGRVSSVQIIKVTGDIAVALKDAIQTWRYSPYLVNGVATPACFVSPFTLK